MKSASRSQPKVNEDQMSSVEMAFNHDLVVAAQADAS